MKSCKNQPNTSISIMSRRSDLCLLVGTVKAACLHTVPQRAVPPLSFLLLSGGMWTSETGIGYGNSSVCVWRSQRSEMCPVGQL